MSRNRGRDTSPEVALRKVCWALGLRYRLHPSLPGTPDFVLPAARIAVFVDGCFWHGCPAHYQAPATRSEFWAEKIRANRRRDAVATNALRTAGWHVVRIWEHDLRNPLAIACAARELWRIAAGEQT
jgi:DNA mismatch endonuclease, patch repair protein